MVLFFKIFFILKNIKTIFLLFLNLFLTQVNQNDLKINKKLNIFYHKNHHTI
jgi:hypothetical protein